MFALPSVSSVIRSSLSTLPPASTCPGKFPSLLAKIINRLLLHACVNHSSMRATMASQVTGLGHSPGWATRPSPPVWLGQIEQKKIKKNKNSFLFLKLKFCGFIHQFKSQEYHTFWVVQYLPMRELEIFVNKCSLTSESGTLQEDQKKRKKNSQQFQTKQAMQSVSCRMLKG